MRLSAHAFHSLGQTTRPNVGLKGIAQGPVTGVWVCGISPYTGKF